NFLKLSDFSPQRGSDRGAGVEEIDVTATLHAVSGRDRLLDSPGFPRPARAPLFHFADALRPLRAHQSGQLFIAETAASLDRIVEVKRDGIRLFLGQSGGNSHLRHDSRAATANLSLIDQQYRCAGPGSSDGRIHTRGSSAND